MPTFHPRSLPTLQPSSIDERIRKVCQFPKFNAASRYLLRAGRAGGGAKKPAEERFVNGGFETGGWTGWTHSSEEISTEQAHSGTYSCRGFYAGGWIRQMFSSPYAIKEDVETFEFWGYGTRRGQISIFYNGGQTAFMFRLTDTTTEWVKTDILALSIFINLPAGATIEGVEYATVLVVDFVDDFSCVG